jgi:hypothetical protein
LAWWKAENQEDQAKNPFRGVPQIYYEVYGKRITQCENLRFYSRNSNSASHLQPSGEYYQSVYGQNGFDIRDFADNLKVFDRNPVNVLFDYLTNTRYGKGLPLTEMDLVSFRNEAQKWYRDANGNLLPNNLRQDCDAVIDTNVSVFDNVNMLLFNMNASLPYINGRFTLKVEDNRNDTGHWGGTPNIALEINENNIIDGMSVQSISAETKYNRIIITFPGGETNEMTEVVWPIPNSALETQLLAEDNGRVNELTIDYQTITSHTAALHRAQVALAKSRARSKTIAFTGDASLQQVNINDIIRVIYSPLGINGTFRITSVQMNLDYTFQITAEEHNANIYTAPDLVVTPDQTYRQGSIASLPIYIKNSDPQVVYIGEIDNAPYLPNDMDELLSNQPEGWEDYIRANYEVSAEVFTQQQLIEGLEDGTITLYDNTDISTLNADLRFKPEILSTQVIQNYNNDENKGDVVIKFKANSFGDINETNVLLWDWQQQQYKTIYTPESKTAASKGEITIKNFELGIPIRFKLQFVSNNNKINSTEQNVNLETYYTENRIITDFFDTPLTTLAKPEISWDYIDETSSNLTWSTADTWESADNGDQHNTITYISPVITDFNRQELWPETIVLYDSLKEDNDTRPNLQITYLIDRKSVV